MIALGAAPFSPSAPASCCGAHAFTVWVDVDVGDAWQRARDSGRPLARDETQFRRLFDERQPLYDEVSAGLVDSAEDVLLEALQIDVGAGTARASSGAGSAKPRSSCSDR